MITTLTGANRFALHAEMQARVQAFLAANDELGLERLDGEEASLEQLQSAVQGLPFLAERKLVVLTTPSANKQFTEVAETVLAGAPDTNDVVLVEPKLDKRLAYYKYLKKSTDLREFNELDARGLAQWLVTATKAADGNIGLSDANYLVGRVGTNQQILAHELDKLLLHDTKITRESIDLLTEAAPQSTIFELLEAAFAGKTQRALELYEEQRALKVEPQQIIAMLGWQLHVLALVKTAGQRSADEIAKEAKLNPFVVRKSQGIARGMTLAHLKQLISDLTIIDARLKRESLNADDMLRYYLLTLS